MLKARDPRTDARPSGFEETPLRLAKEAKDKAAASNAARRTELGLVRPSDGRGLASVGRGARGRAGARAAANAGASLAASQWSGAPSAYGARA